MKKLTIYTIIIVSIGIIPIFIDFGNRVKYFDFISQIIPFILETKRMFATGEPWWSWNTNLGENFIASYGYYSVTSPFAWINCLFPASKILWGILFVFYLKCICCTSFAYLYFKKMEFNENLCIIGGLLYCFSSFYICNLYYFFFCEPIMMFPLLLIAIENVIRQKKHCYFWLTIASLGVVFINFYFALSSFLLGLFYLLFRTFGEKKLTYKLILKSIGSVMLGMMLSSFILLPILIQNAGSTRTEIEWNMSNLTGLKSLDFISILNKYIPLLRALFFPITGDYAPESFTVDVPSFSSIQGFVTIFGLFPVYILALRKRNWLFKLIVFLLLLYFTPFNGLFTAFTSFTYTRWLYGLTLFTSLALLYIVKDNIRVSYKDFIYYFIFCFIIIIINILLDINALLSKTGTFALEIKMREKIEIALFFLNCLCLLIWIWKRSNFRVLLAMISICATINLFAFNLFQFNISQTRLKGINYIIADEIFNKTFDSKPTVFNYRCDFECNYQNIGILKNKPGLFSFHSVINKKYNQFRNIIDDGNAALFSCYRNREAVAALTSAKYIYEYRDSLEFGIKSTQGKKLNSSRKYYDIYDFKYYIPVGFSYDTYIPKNKIETLIPHHKTVNIPILLLDNLVIDSNDIPEISKYLKEGQLKTNISLDSVVSERKNFTVNDFIGTNTGFTCSSDFDADKVIFFSVVSDPGFKALIDNKPTKIFDVNLGMSAIIVPKGYHKIEFQYFPPGLKLGILLTLISLIITIYIYFKKF